MTALLQDTPLTTEQRVFTDTISIGGQALLSVISDILDFSRIESERLDLEAAPFDLHACFASAIDLVAYAARQKGLVVRYTCAPDVPQAVVGDVGRLRQVLLNLLGNAVKFTDQGAVILDVTSAAHGAGSSQLTITVRDTGIGIAAASLAQIFEPFVQADRSVARRHGGTGLGLAISRQLVALMGGTIDVVSTPGAGTTFTVRITLPHAPLAALPRPVEPAITCARSLRVLVAEDNPINQMVMSHMLTGLGHEVTIVADGQQALRAVAHAPYDVVLMDVQMPELDGEATTRHIRSLGAAITQPHIIALTANALGGDRERYLQVGMDDYLSKPVHPADLQRALARASNGRPSII
jgi:CheY-like chemotaxis protein